MAYSMMLTDIVYAISLFDHLDIFMTIFISVFFHLNLGSFLSDFRGFMSVWYCFFVYWIPLDIRWQAAYAACFFC